MISDDGILISGDFIRWCDIREISYNPQLPSRVHYQNTYAEILVSLPQGGEYTAKVMYLPLYGLMKIKKHCPGVKIKYDKTWIFVILIASVALPIIFGLMGGK